MNNIINGFMGIELLVFTWFLFSIYSVYELHPNKWGKNDLQAKRHYHISIVLFVLSLINLGLYLRFRFNPSSLIGGSLILLQSIIIILINIIPLICGAFIIKMIYKIFRRKYQYSLKKTIDKDN